MPERFVRRKIEDEEIWLDFQAGQFYGLNETATAILAAWRDGAREPKAIAERLERVFEVSAEDALRAVTEFLPEAKELGLLEDAG